MLDFSINPTMFHMNNLDGYDDQTPKSTLLFDVVQQLYGKFNTLYYTDTVPILSLRTQDIGQRMWERMDYDASGVAGVIGCGQAVTLTIPAMHPTARWSRSQVLTTQMASRRPTPDRRFPTLTWIRARR